MAEITHKMRAVNDLVSVTISPPPPEQQLKLIRKSGIFPDYKTRKETFVEEWSNIFKHWPGIKAYEFYLEISKNGLLHWHGSVRIEDPQLFNHGLACLKYMYTKAPAIDVDTVNDPAKWREYIKKDHPTMRTKITSRNNDPQMDIVKLLNKKP